MYIRIWNKNITNNKLAVPSIYEVRDTIKHETNVDNIEIPKYTNGNTFLVFCYIISKRIFDKRPGVVKCEHYLCKFTNSFQSAITMIDDFSNKNRKSLSKHTSVLRIYEFSKDSTDILYTDFHNGAKHFMDEISNASDATSLREINLKYADYYRYTYTYNKHTHNIELNANFSGYVYHNSDIFSGEFAGRNWCKWYKQEYMEDL